MKYDKFINKTIDLHMACFEIDYPLVSSIVSSFADSATMEYSLQKFVNFTQEENKAAPLHTVLTSLGCVDDPSPHRDDCFNICSELVQSGAYLGLQNIDQETPFYLSAEIGELNILKMFVKACPIPGDVPDLFQLINIPDSNNATPLFAATENYFPSIVEYLLSILADPNISRVDGCTPLNFAAHAGYSDIVTLLLNHRANLSIPLTKQQPGDGELPIHSAVHTGHFQTTKLLLDRGADPNIPIPYDGRTVLHDVILNEDNSTFQLLLSKNLKIVNSQTKEGVTPLLTAVGLENKDNALLFSQWLLDAGADPNISSKDGLTPILGAVMRNNYGLVKLLISHKSNLNTFLENDSSNAVDIASQLGHSEILHILLENGGKIDNTPETHSGFSPLHRAVTFRHPESIEVLLRHGIDTTLKTITKFNDVPPGSTALDIAKFMKYEEGIQLLERGPTVETRGHVIEKN